MTHVDYPYGFDPQGRTATTTWADHVRDLVEQTLFTSPGERVNRPDFGCGLLQLVFEPVGAELAAAVEATVFGSLQRWLGDVLELVSVEAETDESKVTVSIAYRLLRTGEQVVEQFERSVG